MFLRYMSLAILLPIVLCLSGPADAGTHFVASDGTDSLTCTRTAPCQTINQAVVNAAPNDTVICLDTISNLLIFISKSIDIECTGARAIIRDAAAGASIVIDIAVSGNDPRRTVRLRGISTFGGFVGILIISAAAVSIEDCVVSDATHQGILTNDQNNGQSKLFISDSIIRNNAGAAIVAAAAATSITVLDNVRSENNTYGIAAATGNNVNISRSVFSGNSIAGVEADAGAQVAVDNSTITHNFMGVQSVSSVRLSNNNIAFNTPAISGASGTFGNNRLSANVGPGTQPTQLGPASIDFGEQ